MGKTNFLLFGAGGHARVLASVIEALNNKIAGVFDSNSAITMLDGVPHLGEYDPLTEPEAEVLIAIGDNKLRHALARTIQHNFGRLKHPSAIVDKTVTIGEGTQILHAAIVNRGTVVGKHCILNTASSVDHDCQLADFIHIAPKATLCGGVIVGEGTLVGAAATVLPNIEIGKNVSIGAGAVITKNIPDHAIVVGVPGKIVAYDK